MKLQNYIKIPFLGFMLLLLVSCGTQGRFIVSSSSPISGVGIRESRNFTYSESQNILGTPTYKIGNPYQIKGQWYSPAVNYAHDETGIASWYGNQFQGRRTANGEIFDKKILTAAHRTLPLPSIVIVTNLENGRAIKLRVNDRGPFARGRVIDLSERAAEILGFRAQGTAPVRVRILAEESKHAGLEAQNWQRVILGSNQQRRVAGQKVIPLKRIETPDFRAISPLAVNTAPQPPRQTPAQPSLDNIEGALAFSAPSNNNQESARPSYDENAPQIFVQIGAFRKEKNINSVTEKLKDFDYPIDIRKVSNFSSLKRVRLGPLGTLDAKTIENLLDELSILGFSESHIRVE